MVEGPGCKIKGEKMKGRLKGKVVKGVGGNVVEKENKAKKKNPNASKKYDEFIGRKLDDVQTLGKELFMYFGDKCFRVHFLMAGSFRVNDQVLDHDVSNKADTVSMLLEIGDDKVAFYKCSVDIRISVDCRAKFDRLHSLDICSSTFDHKRAVRTFMEQENRLVCDVLLDQVVLPGVGNIIKNEALFDSGIRPSCRVKELNEPSVSHLIRMTRDFSMIFYKCRKTGAALRRYEKVYHRGTCGQCRGKITRTRMGEDSARLTDYCPKCQTNNPKVARILPAKNSLLGWATSGQDQQPSAEWTCSVCTLINTGNTAFCSACGGRKKEDKPQAIQVPIIKPKERISNSKDELPTSRRTTNRTILSNKRKGDQLPSSPTKKLRTNAAFFRQNVQETVISSTKPVFRANTLFKAPTLGAEKLNNGCSVIDLTDTDDMDIPEQMLQLQKSSLINYDLKSRVQNLIPSSLSAKSQKLTSEHSNLVPDFHGSKSSVHSSVSAGSVHSNSSASGVNFKQNSQGSQSSLHSNVSSGTKSSALHSSANFKQNSLGSINSRNSTNSQVKISTNGHNSSQRAASSSQPNPGMKDSKIPHCPKHNKRCALREVRKEGHNLGRMFFCCALPRGKQCFIFRWADEEFPICEGHGKKCVLRTVLKEGSNNGRKFFACSVDRRKQCKFFQWADEYNE